MLASPLCIGNPEASTNWRSKRSDVDSSRQCRSPRRSASEQTWSSDPCNQQKGSASSDNLTIEVNALTSFLRAHFISKMEINSKKAFTEKLLFSTNTLLKEQRANFQYNPTYPTFSTIGYATGMRYWRTNREYSVVFQCFKLPCSYYVLSS